MSPRTWCGVQLRHSFGHFWIPRRSAEWQSSLLLRRYWDLWKNFFYPSLFVVPMSTASAVLRLFRETIKEVRIWYLCLLLRWREVTPHSMRGPRKGRKKWFPCFRHRDLRKSAFFGFLDVWLSVRNWILFYPFFRKPTFIGKTAGDLRKFLDNQIFDKQLLADF